MKAEPFEALPFYFHPAGARRSLRITIDLTHWLVDNTDSFYAVGGYFARPSRKAVCDKGFNATIGAFTQFYGASALDASLLSIPHLGFLPATDPRVRGTIAAVVRELSVGGLLLRYKEGAPDDGLPPGTSGLADNIMLISDHSASRNLFGRLLSLRNDVGLLSEQYDPIRRRMLGNFPQAFGAYQHRT